MTSDEGVATPMSLAYGAGRAVTRLGKHVELAVAAVGVSVPQYRIMCGLAEGHSGATKLANVLAVRPASVTEIIDGLVARGWVVRASDPNDRRRSPLKLTSTGLTTLRRADAAVHERLAEISSHLEERSVDEAVRFLESWHRALDAYDANA